MNEYPRIISVPMCQRVACPRVRVSTCRVYTRHRASVPRGVCVNVLYVVHVNVSCIVCVNMQTCHVSSAERAGHYVRVLCETVAGAEQTRGFDLLVQRALRYQDPLAFKVGTET